MAKRRLLLLPAVLVFLLAGAAGYLGWRQTVPGVRVHISPQPRALGAETSFTLKLRSTRGGIESAVVRIVQGGKTTVAAQVPFPPGSAPEQELPVTLDGGALGLAEGPAVLLVHARDDFWRPLGPGTTPSLAVPLTVDLTPPALEVVSSTRYLAQGGGGIAVLRSRDAVRVGAKVGSTLLRGFAAGPPENGLSVVLLVVPWDLAPNEASITAFAQDEAGNTAWRPVPAEIKTRAFPKDTLEISDRLLTDKLPELLPQTAGRPVEELLAGFLTVNRDQRAEAEEAKRRIGAVAGATPQWDGAFSQAPNTKVFANFAETRIYRYRGRTVDTQVHFGYDLASVRQAPVPAANSGTVVFTGPMTIYGNTVVLDHGLGLQTLYAHLSSIGVSEGDPVRKDQELGRTGSTGLALGDHLHYEVLIHGVPVTPLEWWDPKWIRDHIFEPLGAAGLTLFASQTEKPRPEAPAQPRPDQAKKKRPARR